MLVKKDDCLRKIKNNKHYRVLMADEEMFLIGYSNIKYKKLNNDLHYEAKTNCEKIKLYSNDESINTLESLGFVKTDFKF